MCARVTGVSCIHKIFPIIRDNKTIQFLMVKHRNAYTPSVTPISEGKTNVLPSYKLITCKLKICQIIRIADVNMVYLWYLLPLLRRLLVSIVL